MCKGYAERRLAYPCGARAALTVAALTVAANGPNTQRPPFANGW